MPNTNDRLTNLEQQVDLYTRLVDLVNLADKVRDLEKEVGVWKEKYEHLEEQVKDLQNSPATPAKNVKKPSGRPPANHERDQEIYDKRVEGMTFPQICEIINKEYPNESLDPDTAQAALRRYTDRHDLPYPSD